MANSAQWNAVAREAGIAAEHICIGVTALGRADYAKPALYGQAFFALGVGLERSSKLALLIDHALRHDGAFPPPSFIRSFGHDLARLLQALDDLSKRKLLPRPEAALPAAPIHAHIVEVLSDFANNKTRYYDLDFLTGDPGAVGRESAVSSWYKRVTMAVVQAHVKDRQHLQAKTKARDVAALLDRIGVIGHTSEVGDALGFYSASLLSSITEIARPYVRMYVLQIARFVAEVVSAIGSEGYGRDFLPDLSEFYRVFINTDQDFRKRKTWTIYV